MLLVILQSTNITKICIAGTKSPFLCRFLEQKHGLPEGCINDRRVRNYVRSGPTRDPKKRGHQSPPHEAKILQAASTSIGVAQLRPGPLHDTSMILDQLQLVYTDAGYPCKSRSHLLNKFRKYYPELFHYSGSEVEDLRRKWCTVSNLLQWHIGYVHYH